MEQDIRGFAKLIGMNEQILLTGKVIILTYKSGLENEHIGKGKKAFKKETINDKQTSYLNGNCPNGHIELTFLNNYNKDEIQRIYLKGDKNYMKTAAILNLNEQTK
jgi:hypothetical protein